jgi:hypothetical protein
VQEHPQRVDESGRSLFISKLASRKLFLKAVRNAFSLQMS